MARSWINDPQIEAEHEERGWLYWQNDPLPRKGRFMSDNEMAVVEDQSSAGVSVGAVMMKPSQVIEWARRASQQLALVIRQKKLSIAIKDREYVRCEGWTTLGAMLGVFPIVEDVEEVEPGTWQAWVRLESGGATFGRASAQCGMDEKMWATRSNNQRRSMAQTRATSKAYRLSFAWIVTMSGFEPTSAEEMQTGEPEEGSDEND